MYYYLFFFYRFSHGPESINRPFVRGSAPIKAILPTELIFSCTQKSAGACRLPIAYTSCVSDISLKGENDQNHFCLDHNTPNISTHNFDTITSLDDAYILDKDTGASIYHFFLFRNDIHMSQESGKVASVYSTRYGQNVMDDLHVRGLELLIKMDDNSIKATVSIPEMNWDTILPAKTNSRDFVIFPEESFDYRLPNNYSTTAAADIVVLPNFANDFSEYLLGALIERVADSYELYATMFFLCHSLFDAKNGGEEGSGYSMSREVYDVWKGAFKHFDTTEYTGTGTRSKPPLFYCNISHNGQAPFYLVEGEFVPSKTTADGNGNSRLDILRCKMTDTERAYMDLAGTNAEMSVQIIRNQDILMRLTIPWNSRKTGFMLSEPEGQVVSTIDPWKGFNKSTPGIWKLDDIYMCVPGWEDAPSKASLPIFLEFFQHHFLLGVDHIFTGVLSLS